MEGLTTYLKSKVAALRDGSLRSRRPTPPSFIMVEPEHNGSGTLQTQYRANGIYNDRRAGRSEFSLVEINELKQHPAVAVNTNKYAAQNKSQLFHEEVAVEAEEHTEETPNLTAFRGSTLAMPEPRHPHKLPPEPASRPESKLAPKNASQSTREKYRQSLFHKRPNIRSLPPSAANHSQTSTNPYHPSPLLQQKPTSHPS